MAGELIKIEKPPRNTDYMKEISSSIFNIEGGLQSLENAVQKTEYPEYLSWKEIKRKNWLPKEISAITFWEYVKLKRWRGRDTPIRTPEGGSFKWSNLRHYERLLNDIDKTNLGGRLLNLVDTNIMSEEEKRRHLSRSLIEESIASAQIEGAHTTREQAKKMIKEGRTPANNSERMIYNNYKTIQYIEENLKNRNLDEQTLLDLHEMLTRDTLDKPDQAGRYRLPEEYIEVGSDLEDKVAYIPPPVEFVKEQMSWLIDWANDKFEMGDFMHPVIKAIALHFWIGFLHPFFDGNGRMARALFYWYLLHNGYWAFAYIPVSTRIKKSPKQYAWSYIYSEQDDNDLTYFIDYNMRQIELARKDFEEYLAEQLSKSEDRSKLFSNFPDFNTRQIELIHHFQSKPKDRTNITALSRIYGVTPATAVKDLKIMEEARLLHKKRQGRNVFYYPTDKLLNSGTDQ